jgi:hypothetical protein
MLAESLDVLLVLHFILIVEDEEGLALGLAASLNSRVDRPQRGSSSSDCTRASSMKSGHLANASTILTSAFCFSYRKKGHRR